MIKYGDVFERLRLENHWNKKECAKFLGVSAQSYNGQEDSPLPPSMQGLLNNYKGDLNKLFRPGQPSAADEQQQTTETLRNEVTHLKDTIIGLQTQLIDSERRAAEAWRQLAEAQKNIKNCSHEPARVHR
jgi:hypothetical protein